MLTAPRSFSGFHVLSGGSIRPLYGYFDDSLFKHVRDGYRQRVLLMTKIDGRDRKTAAAQLEESWRRLQTDRIDLRQFHEGIRLSDPDRSCEPGGALAAVLGAQKAGQVRYIGFSGHKSPEIQVKMLATASGQREILDDPLDGQPRSRL